MKTITEYEIIRHGINNSQYFPGYGGRCTEVEEIATGIGDNPKDAVEECLELLALMGWDADSNEDLNKEVANMPETPSVLDMESREESDDDADRCYPEDTYYYVSVRVK